MIAQLSSPKVSICIPTCNRVHLLKLAVKSVCQQTFTDWELIVCDDGSIDETPYFMAQITDSRIRYLRHEKNIGKSNNMRSGFLAARGVYFIKFDDDDRLAQDFLSKTSTILDNHPQVDFVGCDHWLIDIENRPLAQETKLNSQRWGREDLKAGIVDNLLEIVFIKQSFQVGATLFRREALQAVDFMLPNLQSCEDNDLFVRLALAGKIGYFLPEKLMEYRQHSQQQEIERAIAHLNDKVAYLKRYNFPNSNLESIRKSRLAESLLALGMRLIEFGEVKQGRELIWQSQQLSNPKAFLSLMLSYFPTIFRSQIYQAVRKQQKKRI